MKLITRLGLLLIGLSLITPGFAAKDPNQKAIKARQGEMQLRSFNAGPLFGMAKGDIEYDAELAATLAGNLKLMLDLDNGRAWPTGSDNSVYDDTTATPKIWETYPEIGRIRQALQNRGQRTCSGCRQRAGRAEVQGRPAG